MAETQRNKQTVARLFDAFRDGDVEAFDELIVEEPVASANRSVSVVGERGVRSPGRDEAVTWAWR
jgi:ketosteroid isomerase-like protein